jgi:hypothetical protein
MAKVSSGVRSFASAVLAYAVLAAVLSATQAAMLGLRGATTLALAFGFNAFVALMIGTSIDLGHTAAARVFGLERRGVVVRIAAYVIVVAIAVVIGVESGIALVAVAWPELRPAFPRAGVLFVAIPVTIAMVAIERERDRMRLRATQAERDAEVRTRQALRAELTALQSRTNPHFLFNALNTIAALIAEDPAVAERAVERLASLLRYALDSGRRELVPLRDELAATVAYLELERLRFGDRLRTEIDVADDLQDVKVPPMSLQPLVENAVLHGVAARRAPTTIELWARRDGDVIELGVRDDGPGDGDHHGTGTAQADLRARIDLLFGGAATLDATHLSPTGYRVVLRVPA